MKLNAILKASLSRNYKFCSSLSLIGHCLMCIQREQMPWTSLSPHLWPPPEAMNVMVRKRSLRHMTRFKLTIFISCRMQRSPPKRWLAPAFGYFATTTGLLWRYLSRTSQTLPTPWRSLGDFCRFFFSTRTNGHLANFARSITQSISVIWSWVR
jgi:hypothetical protein